MTAQLRASDVRTFFNRIHFQGSRVALGRQVLLSEDTPLVSLYVLPGYERQLVRIEITKWAERVDLTVTRAELSEDNALSEYVLYLIACERRLAPWFLGTERNQWSPDAVRIAADLKRERERWS